MTDTERDPWTLMPLPDGVADCPCCGSRPQLYKYLKDPDGPRQLEVSCSNVEPLYEGGPVMCTCPLSVPPDYFLCDTIKGAVATWNKYALELTRVRHKNQQPRMLR